MSIIVIIKVVPSAGKQEWIIDKSGQLKCYLKNPPEKGKANNELIKLLADSLKIPQANIQIISGQATRTKKIKVIYEITYEQLLVKLGLNAEKQYALF